MSLQYVLTWLTAPRHWNYCFTRFCPRKSLRPNRIFSTCKQTRTFRRPRAFSCTASPLCTCQRNGLPTGTIPTHTAGRAMGGLFYIKQYGNTPTGRKMSNKDTRALPCYYAITYHPFLRPPFNPPRNPFLSRASTTYIPCWLRKAKKRIRSNVFYGASNVSIILSTEYACEPCMHNA